MVPVTTPEVASARKLMRVAAGRTGVGNWSEMVGEATGVGEAVGGGAVGVAWAWIAAMVAATTVATSLGEAVGIAEFDPVHATMATKVASKARNGFQRLIYDFTINLLV